jgi:hypothetical protein
LRTEINLTQGEINLAVRAYLIEKRKIPDQGGDLNFNITMDEVLYPNVTGLGAIFVFDDEEERKKAEEINRRWRESQVRHFGGAY